MYTFVTCAQGKLEENLQPKLHVEGFARADAGSAVVIANRIGDLSEIAADSRLEWREVGVIEQIEDLGPELYPHLFRYIARFEDREVGVLITGATILRAT